MKKNNDQLWLTYSEKELDEIRELNERYKAFLSNGKTERECAAQVIDKARQAGFEDLRDVIRDGKTLKAGDRVYMAGMNKTVALFTLGKEPLSEGMRILGAHIDSPRLDVKQNPLYEEAGLAYLDTHYYGGVKKYQWVTIPLALHGVVTKTDGRVIPVSIGEKDTDPVLCVTDLLIHLSAEQLEKKARVV
ncbi:MAG: aminopeptidase, partial [Lachnospiraceae bacterium]|nr:aminopeptidase [Lachnospiraceae bacterium]